MFTFLLIVHAVIAAALVTVILMQRSEGGGLGMGGSPSGLMSARGAADFLTKATTILASAFVLMSILLAVMATMSRAPGAIDASLARRPAPAAGGAVPMAGETGAVDPVAAAAGAVTGAALTNGAAAITDTPITNPPAKVRIDPAAANVSRPATRAATRAERAETPAARTPVAPVVETPAPSNSAAQ